MTDLVAATITRLQALKPGSLTRVEGLLSLMAQVKPPIDKMPAAYVLVNGTQYSPQNGLVNAVRQSGNQSVRIVLMIKAKKPEGDDVFDPIEPVAGAVRTQLLGWQPDAEDGQVLIASEKLLDVQANYVTYEMIFFRQHFVRA